MLVRSSLVAQTVKNLPAKQETQVWSLGQEDPLEKEMATYSHFLAWEISWTEEGNPCSNPRASSKCTEKYWIPVWGQRQQRAPLFASCPELSPALIQSSSSYSTKVALDLTLPKAGLQPKPTLMSAALPRWPQIPKCSPGVAPGKLQPQ